MRRIIARTKLTFVSSLTQDSVLLLHRPFHPLGLRSSLCSILSPVVSALHENSLNPSAITRTWRSARLVTQHNRCPQSSDTDLQILRFYRRTCLVESICDRGWSSRFATSFCCRSSLRFYEKGLGANQRVCYNESITARSVSSTIVCIQCKETTFSNLARCVM